MGTVDRQTTIEGWRIQGRSVRRILFALALVVLVGGVTIAVLMPAKVCYGMDNFACWDSRNSPRIFTGIGAVSLAAVIFISLFWPRVLRSRSG